MFAISPTDYEWFEFLKGTELNSYVNFWTPTPWNISGMKPLDRWYFLLKSPFREVAGFGEFVEYKNLTANDAWIEFGQRNGCLDKAVFLKKIQLYINKNSKEFREAVINAESYEIGCLVLKNCEFWDGEDFKKPKEFDVNFPPQVVKFKYFHQSDPFFEAERVESNFSLLQNQRDDNKREVNQRKGQGTFKGVLLKVYDNKCSISGETCPELLEAAHLQRYLNEKSNHVQNGILMRVDLHKLFDSGLLAIDEDYTVHISSQLAGADYKKFDKTKIRLPKHSHEHPSKEALLLKCLNFRK